MADTAQNIYTFQDAIDLLVDFTGSNQGANISRDMRKSVLEAYEEIVGKKDWRCFQRPDRLQTYAPETGTLAYDLATNTFTIDSGTFPSWAEGATISIGEVRYRVASRPTTTTVTAVSTQAPIDDIATGTDFTIFKDILTLPDGFKAMSPPQGEGGSSFWTHYVTPEQWHRLSRTDDATGEVVVWTIMADPIYSGRQAVHLWPAPDADGTIDYLGRFYPRRLFYSGYRPNDRVGTISVSGTTVTGTNTAFTADHVGSVLRISEDGTNHPEGVGGLYPYQYQRLITGYSSATSITVSGDSLGTLTGRKYTISDPINVSRGMLNAIWRGCERKVSYKKGAASQAAAEAAYTQALKDAMADDEPARGPRSCWDQHYGEQIQYWIQGGES
jgi:hypothetical protein